MSTRFSDDVSPEFVSYAGIRVDHRPSRTIRTYSSDQSGTKEYRFNGLGYRGEDFDPNARKRIFVFGCSNTVGVGLDMQETWAHRFRLLCAKHWGLDPQAVNLLNFAEAAASNDSIARMLVSQCSAVRPDVVVANFSHINRKEFIRSEHTFPMMPWWAIAETIATSAPSIATIFGSDEDGQRLARELFRTAKDYYAFFSTETALAETLRNMLLCNFFCAAQGIDYLCAWVEHWRLEEVKNRVIAPLAAAVARVGVIPFGGSRLVDKAADDEHPGPKSSEVFAQALFERYQEIGRRRPRAVGAV